MHPDKAYENFVILYNEYKSNVVKLSETDTRCKIIDYILKDCLGYSEKNLIREPHVDSGFIDYKIEISGIPRLVIEAKKVGECFLIPLSYNSREYKINGVISTISNLLKAMNQARNYCVDIGCKYGVVFNGHQLVLFTAITIGSSWKEGYCYTFNSLEDIMNNFNLFWDILSYERINGGSLIEYLDKGIRDLQFQKVIEDIHNSDEDLIRNNLYTYIQPISELVFSELLDEKRTEILKQCYVFGRTNNPLATDLENYFIDKLPNFLQKYKVRDIMENQTKAGAFQKEYLNKSYSNSDGSIIVLLGGIGSGKSTFLHRFFKIVLSDRENLIWFYIDFRNSPTDTEEIEGFILEKMVVEWESKYEAQIKPLLEMYGFSENKSDVKHYFTKLFCFLQNLKFSITLIIDNVDQHDRFYQEKIFKDANHLKDTLKTVTIVALREETFLASTRNGVFDAYYIPKFHIASPNFLQMIIKRINFTLECFKNINSQTFLPVIPVKATGDLIKYFTIIKSSLERTNKQSEQLKNFIDSVSVGNMREALRMFSNFIVSGNINVKEVFDKHVLSGAYQISYHQFLKAIILGEHRFYSQERSKVINLYDFDTAITDSHFNLLRILRYLNDRNNAQSDVGRGYVMISELISIAETVSIRKNVIYDSLLHLCKFHLVELNNLSKVNITTATYIKITHGGKYYLEYLSSLFVYLDLIYVDTPISNKEILNEIRELSTTTELSKRLYRTKLFINYLVMAEEEEFKNHPEYLSNEFTYKSFSKQLFEQFEKEKKEIAESHIKK